MNQSVLEAAKLNALQINVIARLDDLLDELGVALYSSRKLYYGPCPIHVGNRQDALNIYPEGESLPGYWRCNTKRCHRVFKPTILGFVRGVLSQRNGWDYRTPEESVFPFGKVVRWCCDFIGQSWASLKVDEADLEKRKFAAQIGILNRGRGLRKQEGLSIDVVRKWLRIPSQYFVGRGWSAEVLDRYSVGDYPAGDKPLSNRAVAPIFDDEGKTVVGFTGRSVFDRCEKCRSWHAPGVACESTHVSKWYNQGFRKEDFLYNLWSARPHIKKSGVAILVESPGDCWRLEEAGIPVGLGLLGVDLSDAQQVILERSGATNIIVLTNNDEAGLSSQEGIAKRLRRSFRLHFPELRSNDLGDMTAARVREEFYPLYKRLEERGY